MHYIPEELTKKLTKSKIRLLISALNLFVPKTPRLNLINKVHSAPTNFIIFQR